MMPRKEAESVKQPLFGSLRSPSWIFSRLEAARALEGGNLPSGTPLSVLHLDVVSAHTTNDNTDSIIIFHT